MTHPLDIAVSLDAIAPVARPLVVPGALWRAALDISELLAALVVVLCVPFVILAIGIPIVLSVRVLLWIAGML